MPRLLLISLFFSLPAAAQAPIPMVLLPEQPVAEPVTRPIDGGFPSDEAVHINASGDLLDTPREVPVPEAEVGLVASTPTATLSVFSTLSGWPGYQVSTTWARSTDS